MPQGESLYHKFPDYRVDLEPNSGRIRVRFNGQVVADSRKTVTVHETKHAPVVYFPMADLEMQFFEATDHESFCPFKGNASYWTIRVGGEASENTVWGYADPFEEVTALSDYVAFYPDRVELERDPA